VFATIAISCKHDAECLAECQNYLKASKKKRICAIMCSEHTLSEFLVIESSLNHSSFAVIWLPFNFYLVGVVNGEDKVLFFW